MLVKYGLNNYENKCYVTLLKIGSADARTISAAAEVPYGRIYDTLESLKSKHIVNEISGRPKKFVPIEPDLAIDRLLEERMKDLKSLEKQSEVTRQELNKLYEDKSDDKLIWKTVIGEEMYTTYFNLMNETRYELLIYQEVLEGIVHQIDQGEYLKLFRRLKDRNVKIKIILGVDDITTIGSSNLDTSEFLQLLNEAEVRYSSRFHQGFAIMDKQKVIIKVVNPINLNETMAGIYLWQNSLAETYHEAFENIWEEAIPIQFGLIPNKK